MGAYIPERGDLVWLSFSPQAGHEQAERRPGLVLSPKAHNTKTNLFLVCPITNQIKGYPFEVIIPAGMSIQGAILSDQILNLDWRARQAELADTIPMRVLETVLERIQTLIGG